MVRLTSCNPVLMLLLPLIVLLLTTATPAAESLLLPAVWPGAGHRRRYAPSPVLHLPRGGAFPRQQTSSKIHQSSEQQDDQQRPPPTKEEVMIKQEDAIRATQSCAKTVLITAFIDVLTGGWAARDSKVVERVFVLLAVLWKLGFSSGLYQISKVMENLRGATLTQEKLVTTVDDRYRIMGRLWRQTAQLITLGSIIDLAGVFGMEGSRCRLPIIPRGFAVLAVVSGVVVQAYAMKQIDSVPVPKEEESVHRKASIITRNMALCALALFLRGAVVSPLLALGQTKKIAIVKVVVHAYAPIVSAALLWGWRLNSLEAFRSAVAGEWVPAVQAPALESQKKFYERVQSTLKTEAIVKLLLTIVPPLVAVIKPLVAKSG